jgi:hypothetical protein
MDGDQHVGSPRILDGLQHFKAHRLKSVADDARIVQRVGEAAGFIVFVPPISKAIFASARACAGNKAIKRTTTAATCTRPSSIASV